MSQIRILRVIARMNVGGPAQQIVGLQRGLNGTAFHSRLLTGVVEAGEEDYLDLRAPDLDVTRLTQLRRSVGPLGDASALLAIRDEIRRFQPHVVHTHTAKAGVVGRLAGRLAAEHPILVHTFHGHLLHGYFSRPVTAGVRAVERALARRTARLLAVGAQVRDDLLAAGIGKPEQYEVVPPGVAIDSPLPQREARRLLGLPESGPVVSFVARLTAVKQPHRFIAVVRCVAERVEDVHFVVAGGGPLEAEVRSAAHGLPLSFLGWRGDVQNVYSASDVSVLTSDNEGMPVSVIEAGLCSRPAVATDVGSVREVIADGETGRVVGSFEPWVIAGAIVDLLSDPGRVRRMGEAAERRCRERFSMDRLVRETEELYRSLVEERRGRGR